MAVPTVVMFVPHMIPDPDDYYGWEIAFAIAYTGLGLADAVGTGLIGILVDYVVYRKRRA